MSQTVPVELFDAANSNLREYGLSYNTLVGTLNKVGAERRIAEEKLLKAERRIAELENENGELRNYISSIRERLEMFGGML